MKDVLGADGINLINACGAAAWQTVFHFHIHVVPRYEDDPLKLPWIPEPGDSDEIAAVAAKLRGDNMRGSTAGEAEEEPV
jgi:histidine triad (HIT) family protein